jgi:aromatic-L-amino-acid decarboxylase
MTPEEFRAAGHELIDWIADYRLRLPELPVPARVSPGDVARALPTEPPTGRDTIESLLADLDRIVVPGLTQVQHPRYYGWFPANASLASVLGDIASSGLGALGITWQSAPALTELEEVVCAWLARLTGLPEGWRGSIHDTASTACLVALLAARERASGYSCDRGGLQAEQVPLVVYTSEHAHSSVAKAVVLAGFGRDNLRLVDADAVTFAMRPDALRSAMADDVAAGRRPAVVVVTRRHHRDDGDGSAGRTAAGRRRTRRLGARRAAMGRLGAAAAGCRDLVEGARAASPRRRTARTRELEPAQVDGHSAGLRAAFTSATRGCCSG